MITRIINQILGQGRGLRLLIRLNLHPEVRSMGPVQTTMSGPAMKTLTFKESFLFFIIHVVLKKEYIYFKVKAKPISTNSTRYIFQPRFENSNQTRRKHRLVCNLKIQAKIYVMCKKTTRA